MAKCCDNTPLSYVGAQRKEVWSNLLCLCMPLQWSVQESPAVLQLFCELRMPIWLNWNKTTEGIQPLRPFPIESRPVPTLARRAVGSLEWLDPLWSVWILSKAVTPPFSFPFACGGSQAGPAGVRLHSSAPTEHSGDLWLVLAFFYLNNSPALALKLLSSTNPHLGWNVIWAALGVTFVSRYQFLCVHSTQKLHSGTAGQS